MTGQEKDCSIGGTEYEARKRSSHPVTGGRKPVGVWRQALVAMRPPTLSRPSSPENVEEAT